MATPTSYNLKLNGVVAYSDGSSGPFEVSRQFAINHDPFQSESRTNLNILVSANEAAVDNCVEQLTDTLNSYPYVLSLSFASSDSSKTVTDWTMNLSGLVSYDDSTSGGFCAQYVNGSNNYVGGIEHFQALAANTTARSEIQTAIRLIAPTSTLST
jgi:hypothetical protein